METTTRRSYLGDSALVQSTGYGVTVDLWLDTDPTHRNAAGVVGGLDWPAGLGHLGGGPAADLPAAALVMGW